MQRIYLYPWYIADLSATKNMKKIIGLNVKETLMMQKNGSMTFYYDQTSSRQISKALLNKILEDKDFFLLFKEQISIHSADLMTFCSRIANLSTKELSNEELVVIFKEYLDKLSELRTWGWVPVFLDGIGIDELSFSEYLQSKLKSGFSRLSAARLSELYSIMSSAEKSSLVNQEQQNRLALAIELQKKQNYQKIKNLIKNNDSQTLQAVYPDSYQLIETHRQNFAWLTYYYSGPPMSKKYLLNMLADDLAADPVKELRKGNNHLKNIRLKKKHLIQKYKLNAELRYLFQVSSELMYLKDFRKGIYQKSYLIMDRILQEIAKRANLTLKEVKFLLIPELEAILFKKQNFRAILDQRLQECCCHIRAGQIDIYQGKAGKEFQAKIKNQITNQQKPAASFGKVQGMVAFSGTAHGQVKIVATTDDLAQFKKGNILISPSTNPDLISAMRKAAAIITDHGGIVSHAAIVARELEIPCIVGTKNATTTFQNGDWVKVDANQGTIELIAKPNPNS